MNKKKIPLKKFDISRHAAEQLILRNISEETIKQVLHCPDTAIPDVAGVTVFQKIVKDKNIAYLYRVFVNTGKRPPLVVTAYKTSKIDKYENKIR
jgi:hypothetical protein